MDIVKAMLMQICRLCTKEQSKGERMYHIFKHNEPDNEVMLCRITWVTNLEIRNDDGLPPQICHECYTVLNQSHTFKQQCYASDRELRHFIQNLQGELMDLTAEVIKEERRHINNEDPPNTNTSETSLDNMSYQGIRKEPNKERNSNVINCNERQTGETDNVFILKPKVSEKASVCEMPHLEQTISIPTSAQSTTVNETNDRNVKVGNQVDADINYMNSKEAQLTNSFPKRVCSYVFDKSLVGLTMQSNEDGCEQEPTRAESESRLATTLVNKVPCTNLTMSSEVFDRTALTSPREQSKESLKSIPDYESRSEVILYCFQCKASFRNSNTLKVHLASHAETVKTHEIFTPSIPLEIQTQYKSNNINTNIEEAVTSLLSLEHCDPKVISLSHDFDPNVMPLSKQSYPKVLPLNNNSDLNVTPIKHKDSVPKVKPINTLVCRDTAEKMPHLKHSAALIPLQIQTKANKTDHVTYTESKVIRRDILTHDLSILLPKSTIELIHDDQSVNNEKKSQAVGPTTSECTSIKNSCVSMQVALERCDSRESYLAKGRYTNQLETKHNQNSVKRKTIINTKVSPTDKRDYTKKQKFKKNDLGEINPSNTSSTCKLTQHTIKKEKNDSAVSSSKAEFEDLEKPIIQRNGPGNLVHKRKYEISKISRQQGTQDLTIKEERSDFTTEVTNHDQIVHKHTYPLKNCAYSNSNGDARTKLVSEPNLSPQGCISGNLFGKAAMHQVSVNKKSKLPEHVKSTSKEKRPQTEEQKNFKKKYDVKTENNSPTQGKIVKHENNSNNCINNTLSKHTSIGSMKSKSHLKPREIPHETLALTKMLKSHFETARPYACTYCDKQFKYNYVLSIHIRKYHTGETPFSCHHCDKKYTDKRLLKRHIQLLHIAEKPFPCQICPKTYLSRRELAVHTMVHNNERPFKCSMCPKAYTTAQNLKSHHVSHLGERNFHCNLCTKSFWLKSILTDHLRTHNKEKIFCCVLCGKGYCNKKSLKYHERAHKKVRSYVCKLCPATFIHPSNLQEHMRRHNGNTFDCTICKKSFVKRTKLREHLVAHSGKKPFACVPCGKTFLRKAGLMRHKTNKHLDGILPIITDSGPDLNQ